MLTIRTIFALFAIFSFGFCTSVAKIYADTRTAVSCSLSDVTAAYNAASAGDTVAIPAGNCSWSSNLTISKAIALIGAGKTSTIITNNGVSPLISIDPRSDVPVRVSAIGFDNSSYVNNVAVYIYGSVSEAYELSQIRIDNCKFTNGKRAITVKGWVEGVNDHNEFLNCEIAIGLNGDNTYSWERPIAAGTGDFLFIEDNTFTIDNNFPESQYEPEQQIYHQEGARSVTRYNNFDGTTYTEGNYHAYDIHGNQKYYSVGNFRGQPLVEIYENVIACHHSYRTVELRGGSILFYNNTLTTLSGSCPSFQLSEEESWQTAFFNPLDTAWPAEDQIMNCFFWGNTRNGSPVTSFATKSGNDLVFIQENRDYFWHAPASSGGKATYTGRPGGAESFSSSGANAYYPYTPYTYPHPLVVDDLGGVAGDDAPSSPKDLQINQ